MTVICHMNNCDERFNCPFLFGNMDDLVLSCFYLDTCPKASGRTNYWVRTLAAAGELGGMAM